MKKDTLQRTLVVLVVTLIAIWLITPTVRYFLGTSGVIAVSDEKLAELKTKSVPLGLDLQGGVDLLLAVDTQATRQSRIDGYAESLRTEFTKESPPIDATVEATSGSDTIRVVLDRADQERAASNIIEARAANEVFVDYTAGSLKAKTPMEIEVNKALLDQDLEQTVENVLQVLRNRVDSQGLTQPIVVRQGTDRIRVQIPGEKDPERAIRNIVRPALLEFRAVYTTTPGPEGIYRDSSAELISMTDGTVLEGKRIPPGFEVLPFLDKGRNAEGVEETVNAFMVVKKRPEMTGSGIRDARVQVGQADNGIGNEVSVTVEFNADGTEKFADITERSVNRPLAIVLDRVVRSAPNIMGPITEGNCRITGGFNQMEASDLVMVLRAGALPAQLITKDMRSVEATLGVDSIKKSVVALALASAFVGFYMILYYGAAGIIAVIALIINVILIFAFMKLSQSTLTLSGIGGIMLSVGMAVDANILIYERIREELKAGKTMRQAIQQGFARAWNVIVDANITTLISGLVLLQFGEGSVRGFAISLNIGILVTLFTGLFVTRALCQLWFEKLSNINFGTFSWFRDSFQINFLGLRKFSFIFSGALFIICLLWIMPFRPFPGSNWGVDFEGGLLTEVTTTDDKTPQEVQGEFADWRVQKVAGENRFILRSKLDETNPLLEDSKNLVIERLNQNLGSANAYQIQSSEAVSSEVGAEFTYRAVIACIMAAIGILIYIAFRFEFAFGLAAFIALFHDVIITYGLFNILSTLGWGGAGEVTLDVIAALLVVIGFSINDTIVIFDRVRENRKLYPTMPDKQLINTSICESINRTVMTFTTVIVVMLVMLIFGGAGLYDFALVLLIGTIKGTYSSSFIAAPLLYEIHKKMEKKQVRKPGRDTRKVRTIKT